MKVVTDTGQLIVNETLKKLQDDLPVNYFIRVHKSFIISRNKIRFIEGNYVQLGDKSIPIGATYRNEVLAAVEKRS
jgi:DNA-binding LytR/AlgR family response regulator